MTFRKKLTDPPVLCDVVKLTYCISEELRMGAMIHSFSHPN